VPGLKNGDSGFGELLHRANSSTAKTKTEVNEFWHVGKASARVVA
jgi:hypothetical protein